MTEVFWPFVLMDQKFLEGSSIDKASAFDPGRPTRGIRNDQQSYAEDFPMLVR